MVRHLVPGAVLAGAVVGLSGGATVFAAERSPSRNIVQPVVLTAAMVGVCQTSDDVLALARSEAARVWSPAGVIVRWVTAAELPYQAPLSEWLLVRCNTAQTPDAESRGAVIPIAAIRFVGGRPTNTIALSLHNADTLIQRETRGPRDPRSQFGRLRKTALGRMLGRAIAHEIGHFLTQSGEHTPRGLMRATHTVAALIGNSLGPFTVGEPVPRELSHY